MLPLGASLSYLVNPLLPSLLPPLLHLRPPLPRAFPLPSALSPCRSVPLVPSGFANLSA